MSRITKRTRMKGLSPQLQLNVRDAATGSYPTVARTGIVDNRTGIYSASYSDSSTIRFGLNQNIKDNIALYYRWRTEKIVSGTPGVDSPVVFAPFYISGALGEGGTKEMFHMSFLSWLQGPLNLSEDVPFVGTAADPNNASVIFSPINPDATIGYLSQGAGSLLFDVAQTEEGDRPISIAFWIRPLDATVVDNIISNVDTDGANCRWRINTTPSEFGTRLNWTLISSVGNSMAKSTEYGTYTTGWKHFVCTYDGSGEVGGMKIYQDGARVDITSDTAGTYDQMPVASNATLVLGHDDAEFTPTTTLDAFLNDLIIFNRDLSPHQVQEIYGATTTIYEMTASSLAGNYYGLGLPTNSPHIDVPSEMTTSLYGTSYTRAGIGDTVVHFTPGQDLLPYKDSQHVVESTDLADAYFLTGTNVPGFMSPLSSKRKIEIDMPVATAGTFFYNTGSVFNTSTNSYPMVYYNFVDNKWEGLGLGYGAKAFETNQDFFDNGYLGFSPSLYLPELADDDIGLGSNVARASFAGLPVSTFGFPWHPKFHATSSQQLSMKEYIDRPFLVEKIVFDTSVTFAAGPFTFVGETRVASSNTSFFVLCQRRPGHLNQETTILSASITTEIVTASIPQNRVLSAGGSEVFVDSIRDMVSFYNITSYATEERDLAVGHSIGGTNGTWLDRDMVVSTGSLPWNQSLQLHCEARSMAQTNQGVCEFTVSGGLPPNVEFLRIFLGNEGGRSGLGLKALSGRDLGGPYVTTNTLLGNQFTSTGLWDIIEPSSAQRHKPYLMMPEDKLIVGWQIPYPTDFRKITNSFTNLGALVFAAGSYKMVIYGSYVSNDQEENEGTLNQLLSSNAIHEALE